MEDFEKTEIITAFKAKIGLFPYWKKQERQYLDDLKILDNQLNGFPSPNYDSMPRKQLDIKAVSHITILDEKIAITRERLKVVQAQMYEVLQILNIMNRDNRKDIKDVYMYHTVTLQGRALERGVTIKTLRVALDNAIYQAHCVYYNSRGHGAV